MLDTLPAELIPLHEYLWYNKYYITILSDDSIGERVARCKKYNNTQNVRS
jgi:hypothetical protein